jgi:type IV pilus assembly protein PilA
MRKMSGFSLIELLIVVAIILIIAAIAVPNYLHSRELANESAAVGALRTLNTAQISYNSAYPTVGYSSSLSNLGPGSGATCTASPTTACLIDSVLVSGTKSGYIFSTTGVTGTTPLATYQFIATPVLPNFSGTRYFCSYADAVVRFSMSALTSCDNTVSPQQ